MTMINKPEFMEVVKEIIFDECVLKHKESLTETSSFKYDHDLSSIDVATILVALEAKYNVDMDFFKQVWLILYKMFIHISYKPLKRNVKKHVLQFQNIL